MEDNKDKSIDDIENESLDLIGVEKNQDKPKRGIVLNALLTSRNMIREIARIKLGTGLEFNANNFDENGWPAISLALKDIERPSKVFPSFKVSAIENDDGGDIYWIIKTATGESRSNGLKVSNEEEIKMLPSFIKEQVQEFIKEVAKQARQI